ncbi:MAG: Crp/Fnr family transcriptional regulator [Alphaproteobacteria bacterium]|nr:Crp/Fnr family transcriptional regulator [Alphaproteobacteria bacterium]
MSLIEEVELLRNIPLFCKIEPSKLKLLAFTSERLTFTEGQDLVVQGDMGDSAYVLVDGTADVIVNTPDGPLTVAKVSRNAIIGEIAIICDVPRTATVRATSELTALRISKELFFQLVTEFPQMAVEMMRELARRLERTTAQLTEAMSRAKG